MDGIAWLILPTYNEAENIEAIVLAAADALARAPCEGFRVLIVDDGSPDGTGGIAERLAGEHAWLRVLHRSAKEGIGPAYLAGFRHALQNGAAFVLEMDSDFSHDPADLTRLLGAIADGADLALGSRYVPGGGVSDWGLVRRLVSEGGSTYARLVLGLRVHDLTGGFKCFRREVLQAIHFDSVRSRGYAFQVELTYRAVRAGFRVVEVPIRFRDRQHGQSKMSWRIAAEAMWLVPQLRVGRQPPTADAHHYTLYSEGGSAAAAKREADSPGAAAPNGEAEGSGAAAPNGKADSSGAAAPNGEADGPRAAAKTKETPWQAI
jgi:dolichol-phosphate mannosyltransferase